MRDTSPQDGRDESAATSEYYLNASVDRTFTPSRPRPSGARVKAVVFVGTFLFVASFVFGFVVQPTASTEVGSLFDQQTDHVFDAPPASGEEMDPAVEVVPAVDDRPILAVVIDDWGYLWEASDDFLAFEHPLTVAVLPYLPRTEQHAQDAYDAGHQVILHLPMEPVGGGWDLGPRGVTSALADDVIRWEVHEAVASIPHVTGVNNHMGSKATADHRVMHAVLSAVKQEDLFFLDSFTTRESVVSEVAEQLGVPHVVNDIFIDSDRESENVYSRLISAANIAKRCQYAVAIGHVRSETFQGLIQALPVIEAAGVRLGYLWEVLDMGERTCH